MNDIAIRIEGLGKQYRIGASQERYATLRDRLTHAVYAPFRRAGKLLRGQATGAAELDKTIWALKDVSFEVARGEVIGVIGRNGAGKSTLLKILSRITEPTIGYADVYGRVGSLLEVGTGFHQELTGRENIYLNGAILGMRGREIDAKFDKIVAFAEVDEFIDTPTKHYSSGMYLRLAFAVAAHLEPEILLVDEVLAVGDASFQKKSLGKMGDIAREGRTVLFVSHNMSAISQLCSRVIVLDAGKVSIDTSSEEAIQVYLSEGISSETEFQIEAGKPAQIRSVSIRDQQDALVRVLDLTDPFVIRVTYQVSEWGSGTYLAVGIANWLGVRVLWSNDVASPEEFARGREPGVYEARITVPGNTLAPGRYTCSTAIVSLDQKTTIDHRQAAIGFELVDRESMLGRLGIKPQAVTVVPLTWETRPVGDSSLAREE